MKKPIMTLIASMVLVGLAGANIISINISDNDSSIVMSSSSLAGVSSNRVANWNNIASTNNSALSGANAIYANGTAVGGSFQATYTTPITTYLGTSALVNDPLMFGSYSELQNGQSSTLTLTGIPFENYEIYVFSGPASAVDRGGSFTVGSTTYYQRRDGTAVTSIPNDGSGYVQMTTTEYNPADPSTVTYGNYAVFAGLSGSSQTIRASALNMGNAYHRLKICGIQIVSTDSAPQPYTPPPPPIVTLGSTGGGQDVLNWTTVQGSGYVYSVYYSTNLPDGFQPLETNLADTVQGLTNTINELTAFYKVEAQ